MKQYVPKSLDEILTEAQCRAWLQIESEREFADRVRAGVIPAITTLGQRTKRFHPRTVLKRMRQELPQQIFMTGRA